MSSGKKNKILRGPTYFAWASMLRRCRNPNSENFKYYGGRGITVCQEWEKYENFLRDMGERPHSNLTLDRKDNELGYFKDNCRWATRVEQHNNKRNNVIMTFAGFTLTAAQWERKLGIRRGLVSMRMWYGFSIKESLRPFSTRSPFKKCNRIGPTKASVFLEHDGLRLHSSEWARRLGLSPQLIYARMKKGYPIKDVLRPLPPDPGGAENGSRGDSCVFERCSTCTT